MLRRVRDCVMMVPLMLVCIAGHATPLAPYPTAKVTVNGTELLIGGAWDNGNITVDFNGFLETVHYGQYSSNISLASALAAMFTRDYLSFGLYAKAGANVTDPNVITFQLANGSGFGPLNVTGPSTSFTFATSGFASSTSGVPDQGTATLLFNGSAISTVSYGDGSTSASIAQDLALKASSSLVTVTAEGSNVYLQSKQTGTYSDTYSLSFSTSLSFSSSPGGTLSGTSETTSVPVYSYSVTNSSAKSGYDATGNVKNVTDSIMGTWSYSYDDLNRLIAGQASTATYAGKYTCWSYDNFGNRTHQSISNQPFVNAVGSPCAAATGASLIDTAVSYGTNNRISSATSPALTVAYDGAGNVTNDGYNSYLYDAEGRICALNGPQGMFGYQYDAAGNRVGRGTITSMSSCDVTQNGYQPASDYVLDLGGGQMTEVSVGGGTQTWGHTNVTANGMLIATYDTTGSGLHFYLNDSLGSRRVQTDPAGFPEQSCQNLPFGDQLYCTGSLTSPTEHHFTGKERDTESGLDYFGARYMASTMGRWISPDYSDDPDPVPYADLGDPQSLNLYGYVGNNPLSQTDDDGHCYGQQQTSVWTCIGAFFRNYFVGSDDSSSPPGSVTLVNVTINYGPVLSGMGKQVFNDANALGRLRPPPSGGSMLPDLELAGAGEEVGAFAAEAAMLFAPGGEEADFAGVIEKHHLLPQAFASFFERAGLDIEDHTIPLTRAQHRLRPNGVHAQGAEGWNQVWGRWIADHPNARKEQILKQLAKMRKDFGI